MKILAVIPARAGSKGIPNKNIRMIAGHPLIYYAIRNALHSQFITDTIVTTDSPDVRIIATQMGAKCKWRDASLTGDEVTLDAVIADAIPEGPWDYIVTMQPTSPTLKVETLDKAINYAIENQLDTVISAINAPHLSWGLKDGKKVPNYTKRLNRQYLPPCYMETGAFVISRSEVVTPETRIGEKVDVYEVPENEAQDVDTFSDLRSVADTLNAQKVAIYVNGNNKRGIGHIYRALEIADEFYVKPDIYYDKNQTDPKVFGKTTHQIKAVDGIAELFDICRREQYTIFINDILTTSIDYMIGLRSVLPNAKIINFEDDGEGIQKADLVFNALYEDTEFPQIHAGEEFYICGKTFMFYEPIKIKDQVKRVFISFGGADPQNYTDRVMNIVIKPEYDNYEFVVALGRAKHNVEELLAYNKYKNMTVLYDVTNMPELMSSCDVAITSKGRTSFELALLGIPSIAMAQNHREEKHGFVCNENGFSYIGLNPDDEIIESYLRMYMTLTKKGRQRFQDMLLSHDLRNGRRRVMTLINNL
jgi:CMP-N-acetylneuraminic acid synthetase